MNYTREQLAAWLKANEKPEIAIDYKPATKPLPPGASKLGGLPDVPTGFVWPRFQGTDHNGAQYDHPLSFMAQFDLAELAAFDVAGLLPKAGHLAFFYDCDGQPWGYDPKDRGCARVFYFPPEAELMQATPPEDLEDDFQIPVLKPVFSTGVSRPSREYLIDEDNEIDDDLAAEFWPDDVPDRCKLLGWPDMLQGTMEGECQLAGAMRVYCGSAGELTEDQEREYEAGVGDWVLLLQLGTLETRDYEMMFGDCGHIFFWIRKQDLAALKFDDIWLVLQCF